MQVYPRYAARRKRAIDPNSVFLLMPFAKEFSPVQSEIVSICDDLGFTCERADDISSQSAVMSSVLDGILSSAVVLADLTGRNANVFYETGVSHSLRDHGSVILISQRVDDIPFDLRHLPVVPYRFSELSALGESLRDRLSRSQEFAIGSYFCEEFRGKLPFDYSVVDRFVDDVRDFSERFFFFLRCAWGIEKNTL